MENFLIRGIDSKLISEEVNNFIFYDFPKFKTPEKWQADYLTHLEKIMNEEKRWTANSYCEYANTQFVSSFKTILGKSLARVVLNHKEEPMSFSHLMFPTEELCEFIVKAKERTVEKLEAKNIDRVRSFAKILEAELYKEMEKHFKNCAMFKENLENAVEKVVEEKPDCTETTEKSADSSTPKEADEIAPKNENPEIKSTKSIKSTPNMKEDDLDLKVDEQELKSIGKAIVNPWLNPINGVVFVVVSNDDK